MKFIRETVAGTVVTDGVHVALRLPAARKPDPANGPVAYLAYALTTHGPGHHFLPSLLLDDWGAEVKGLRLYRWISENGLRFPRAELFGQDLAGANVQYFLRDIELFARHPVYAFDSEDATAESGRLLHAMLLDGDGPPRPANPLPEASELLRQAQVSWWRVGQDHAGLDFLDQSMT